jgi:selenide,water dikinase
LNRLLLLGGGHTHVEVIRRLGLKPPHDTQVILISPNRHTAYSGMLPGFVAGHYDFHDCHIDLEQLCETAGVELRMCHAIGIDPAANRVDLSDGSALQYDLLSIDIGSTPATRDIPGALDFTTRVKPVERFIEAWHSFLDTGKLSAAPLRIGVVGGGPGGVELALAMHYRMLARNNSAAIHVFTDTSSILPGHPSSVQRIFERVLDARGITINTLNRIAKVEHGMLFSESGESFNAELIIWATAAGAPEWLAKSGIQTDAGGFVAVNDALQSVSHPRVFAAGDIASMVNHVRPKSGVYAVRQGPPLAENLQRALSGRPLADYAPQKIALALISTGDKYAVSVYDKLVFKGKWVWHWKDHIDRRFMNKYNSLPPKSR